MIDSQASRDLEAELLRFEDEERVRLGLGARVSHWTDTMVTPRFTAKQRAHTTVLLGGLTIAHDYLVEGALKGRGFTCRALAPADNDALRLGKEFGNNGQCNPTHFTVGNLIKELSRLRDDEGMEPSFIIEHYVFFTAGACGPCRFGMYVTEYRKALRDAGFEGFRVMLFQQTGGIAQASGEEELGLPLDPPFFLAIARALFAGDVINALGYRIRPYELEPGATDRALTAAKHEVYTALANSQSVLLALRRARAFFEAIRVDRTRPKPRVHILGEFWAMTTEGDGNYHLQRFIEREGGENEVQLLVFLLLYNLWEVRHDTAQRLALKGADTSKLGLGDVDVALRLCGVWAGERALHALFQAFAHAIGLRDFELPNMDEIANVARSHYNPELRGGEGHVEVAKVILNVLHKKAHMTLSVKPFGCMPSSGVSDGVQSLITERYPEAIFCTVETSGEAEVNFHSRVQLFLFKAKQRAQQELDAALAQYGISRTQARDFIQNTRYGRALHRSPRRSAGTATDLIHEIAPLIKASNSQRARIHLTRWLKAKQTQARTSLRTLAKTKSLAPHIPALIKQALKKP
jgi:predicted nucleotide-binding protein (sugar kinase/HSP70/actin superfamily)